MNYFMKIFVLFNPNYQSFSNKQLILQYKKDSSNNNIIKSVQDFENKYIHFDCVFYLLFNKKETYHLIHFNHEKKTSKYEKEKIYAHWLHYGKSNDLINSKIDFLLKFPRFNISFYQYFYQVKQKEAHIYLHYQEVGKYKQYFISKEDIIQNYDYMNHIEIKQQSSFTLNPQSFNKTKFIEIYFPTLYSQLTSEPSVPIKFSSNTIQYDSTRIKIAHVFVHFFQVGGGENFVSQFINMTQNKFHHAIFVSDDFNNETKIKFNIPITIYHSKEELKQQLETFHLIIDHQLYYFPFFNDVFEDQIFHFKILRFIHGVDIYKKNIKAISSFQYCINLYEEHEKHESWNGILSYKNYLGIENLSPYIPKKNPFHEKLYQDHSSQFPSIPLIKICIVGRIDQHKIPKSFLDLLIQFVEYDMHKKGTFLFSFSFYGTIEDDYKNYFLHKINHVPYLNYKNYVSYDNISSIYEDNDILMHPSLSEAGATVILEAMNYGLPIICRKSGGNLETLRGTLNITCKNDQEYFDTLIHLQSKYNSTFMNNNNNNNNNNHNNHNNKDIHFIQHQFQNIKKTLLHHNIKQQFYHLEKIIYHLKDNQKNNELAAYTTIQNKVHYIYGLKEQNTEFSFLQYISIFSNIIINQPTQIFMHYIYEPNGYWWNRIKHYLHMQKINQTWFPSQLKHYAHKSDYLRLYLLYHYGGIYYDLDTLCIKSHHHLLNNECVWGIQENYQDKYDLLCNAIIFAKPGHFFIKKCLDLFIPNFNEKEWCYASMHIPSLLYKHCKEEHQQKITILPSSSFYTPNYNMMSKLFHEKNQTFSKDLITYHYWSSNSSAYTEKITSIEYIYHYPCLFSSYLNHINQFLNQIYFKKYYSNFTALTNNLELSYFIHSESSTQLHSNIHKIGIIMYDIDYESLLIDILNQQCLFALDFEIWIIDNKLDKFIENHDQLLQLLYYKNIKVSFLELKKKNHEIKKEEYAYLLLNNNREHIFIFNQENIHIKKDKTTCHNNNNNINDNNINDNNNNNINNIIFNPFSFISMMKNISEKKMPSMFLSNFYKPYQKVEEEKKYHLIYEIKQVFHFYSQNSNFS
jgi:hypothetical protein